MTQKESWKIFIMGSQWLSKLAYVWLELYIIIKFHKIFGTKELQVENNFMSFNIIHLWN